MAYFRISELTPGAMPVASNTLLEISVPDVTTSSGYDSYQISVDQLFTDRILVGTPLAPTAAAGTRTTQIATTEFVLVEIDIVLAELRDLVLDLIGQVARLEQRLPQ